MAPGQKAFIFLCFFCGTLVTSSIDYTILLYPVCTNYSAHVCSQTDTSVLLCMCPWNQPPKMFLSSRNAASQMWVSGVPLQQQKQAFSWAGPVRAKGQSRGGGWGVDFSTLLQSSWAWFSFGAPSSRDTLKNGRGCRGWLPWCLASWKIQSKALLSRESHTRQSPEAPSNLTFSRLIWFLTLCSSPGQTSSLQSWRERRSAEFSAPQCSSLCSSEPGPYLRVCPYCTIKKHCCKHLSR